MGRGKCDGAGLSALTDRTPRRRVINRRHATIQVKVVRKSSLHLAIHPIQQGATASQPSLLVPFRESFRELTPKAFAS
jgi:hypothetical protein